MDLESCSKCSFLKLSKDSLSNNSNKNKSGNSSNSSSNSGNNNSGGNNNRNLVTSLCSMRVQRRLIIVVRQATSPLIVEKQRLQKPELLWLSPL